MTHWYLLKEKEKEKEEALTLKLVAALLGLRHAAGQLGHLRHHVVQLGRLALPLHDDREHGQTGQHRAWGRREGGGGGGRREEEGAMFMLLPSTVYPISNFMM